MILLLKQHRLVWAGIALGGFAQLALCVSGAVDIGLVLLVYAAEAAVLLLVSPWEAWLTLRHYGAAAVCLFAGLGGLASASWTPWTIGVAIAMWALTVAGWLWQLRKRGLIRWRSAMRGEKPLYLVVLFVGLIGVAWAHDHRALVAHGWPGEGNAADLDLGTRIVSWIIESGVAPLTVPAVLLVAFRTMNEVFLELFRMLGQSPSGSSSSDSDAPSSSRTTA